MGWDGHDGASRKMDGQWRALGGNAELEKRQETRDKSKRAPGRANAEQCRAQKAHTAHELGADLRVPLGAQGCVRVPRVLLIPPLACPVSSVQPEEPSDLSPWKVETAVVCLPLTRGPSS